VVPKPKHKEQKATSATMQEVCKLLSQAFNSVSSNKGAAGSDGQSIAQVREHWAELEPRLQAELLNGSYKPGDVRRVWIPMKSERAGQRVMASISKFIESRLRLKINAEKSAVARPEERHFLGFRLKREPIKENVEVLLSKRTKERIDSKIRELTPRNWGQSLARCIGSINEYLVGWIGFFAICTPGVQSVLKALDAHIRRRLRAIQITHWKTKRTIVRKLIQLGASRKTAWSNVHKGRPSRWAMSRNSAVHRGLRNAYFAERGPVSLAERWMQLAKYIGAPGEQLQLILG